MMVMRRTARSANIDRGPCVQLRLGSGGSGISPVGLLGLLLMLGVAPAIAADQKTTLQKTTLQKTTLQSPAAKAPVVKTSVVKTLAVKTPTVGAAIPSVIAKPAPHVTQIAGVAAPLSPQDTQIFRDAVRLTESGSWSRAQALADGAKDKLPARIIRWMDLVRVGGGHDFSEEAEFITANPDWPQQGTLKVRAEASITTVSDEILRPWFEAHKPVTPLAKLRAADLLVTAGHTDEAASQVREIWVNDDFGGGDERAILARYEPILRPDDHLHRLDRLLWDAKGEDAQRMLDLVPADWRLLAEARIKLNTGMKGAEAAADRVPESLRDHPGLLYERMRWYRKHDMEAEAARILEQTNTLGRPEIWWPERQILARKLLQSDPGRAYRIVANHQLKDPALLTDAEFLAGWLALRFLKEPQKALGHFTRLADVAKLPVTQARGGYWLGRTHDALGNHDKAVEWYNKAARHFTTYYGQLASAEPGVAPLGKPSPEPRANRDEATAFHGKDLVRAARLFAAIDEPDRVRIFVARLTELARTPADHALVADLAEDLGRADLGVSAAKKASYMGVSLLRAGYPVVATPRNAGAEQPLLLAFTRQESAFDVRAVSSAGALGLMQLLPGTASDMAKATTLPYNQKRLTDDGIYNIALGQAFVDNLLAGFNGSYVLSIAAYNAGPGRVRQWLQQFGDPRNPETDVIDWVEQIPFTETRNYVQRVLENLQIYRLRIGNKALAFSLESDLRR